MKRRQFLTTAGAASLACSTLSTFFACSTAQKRKPNIIFILADDLGYGDLSCYGQTRFRTPHLDKMAEEG
ncbi:sulfatase-like hydrolase/transferase, partial [candidate division KSB1 bacterium]